jgi:hypothetical protein
MSLIAPPSDWRGEVTAQIRQINEPHLIVGLDDFLLQKQADQSRLSMLVGEATQRDLSYLRLVPLGKSLIGPLKRLIDIARPADMEPIRAGRPFYPSPQIAIWKRWTCCQCWNTEDRSGNSSIRECLASFTTPSSNRPLLSTGIWSKRGVSSLMQVSFWPGPGCSQISTLASSGPAG